MTDKKRVYSSILDNILDDFHPSEEVGLSKTANSTKVEDSFSVLLDRKSHSSTTASDWRGTSQAAIQGSGLLGEVAQRVAGNKNASEIEKIAMSDKSLRQFISNEFHLGRTPIQVQASLTKLADLQIFNKTLAGDTLKEMAGVVGYTYLEPNHFNVDCGNSKEKIQKEGRLIAKSVKKIAACDSCSSCKSGHCAVYKLPIVASSKELRAVARQEAARFGKVASKQVLTSLHNGDIDSPTSISTMGHATHIAGFENITKDVVKSLTKEHIASSVEAAPLMDVYRSSSASFGKVAAKKAIGSYLNSLKTSAARVVIAHVDCSVLVGKLASTNAIVGESKCASCAYRGGMHCGLTGGTLLSFPGMDRIKSSKRASENAPSGEGMINDYEMTKGHAVDQEIEMFTASTLEIEPSGSLTLE